MFSIDLMFLIYKVVVDCIVIYSHTCSIDFLSNNNMFDPGNIATFDTFWPYHLSPISMHWPFISWPVTNLRSRKQVYRNYQWNLVGWAQLARLDLRRPGFARKTFHSGTSIAKRSSRGKENLKSPSQFDTIISSDLIFWCTIWSYSL